LTALNIKIIPLDNFPGMPVKYHEDDACFDVMATEERFLLPGRAYCSPLGFALDIPPGYKALLVPRSGLARDYGLTIPNSPTQIDSGYKGEVHIILSVQKPFRMEWGNRIAQMYFEKVLPVTLELSTEISTENDRGGGLGSSGV
jgi:dUTP pyrophosphatase